MKNFLNITESTIQFRKNDLINNEEFTLSINGIRVQKNHKVLLDNKIMIETNKYSPENAIYEITKSKYIPAFYLYSETPIIKTLNNKKQVYGYLYKKDNIIYFENKYPDKSELCLYEYQKNFNENYESNCNQSKCINLCDDIKFVLQQNSQEVFQNLKITIVRTGSVVIKKYKENEKAVISKYNLKDEITIDDIYKNSLLMKNSQNISFVPFDYNGIEGRQYLLINKNHQSISDLKFSPGYMVFQIILESEEYNFLMMTSNI